MGQGSSVPSYLLDGLSVNELQRRHFELLWDKAHNKESGVLEREKFGALMEALAKRNGPAGKVLSDKWELMFQTLASMNRPYVSKLEFMTNADRFQEQVAAALLETRVVQ